MTRFEHDVVGVGIGPFNLGLAALLDGVDELDARFFDGKPQFAWHPGLMLDEAEVQVPFLADLVTLADPTSPYSFLAYLHARGRLYRFYFHEQLHVLRREFDAYYRWVSQRLASCSFGARVTEVAAAPAGGWSVRLEDGAEHRARAVVLGVGGVPVVPDCARPLCGDDVVHTADYAGARERALRAARVTVLGSGQSAAEVVADVLDHAPAARLDWFTRSAGFLPMEYSKLGLEHFSPEYVAHFHGLPEERRDALRAGQDLLYKGIAAETSARIFDALYRRSIDGAEPNAGYAARCELRELGRSAGGALRLVLHHLDEDVSFTHETDVLVLGTGYRDAPLPVPALAELAVLDAHGRPVIEADFRVRLRDGAGERALFVQNAELHSHGVGAPDLGLGAHRNAVIVNALCGREVYAVRERNVFQTFGAPGGAGAAARTGGSGAGGIHAA
ncbi:MAG: SidA/IucD/PvdA family monooxygenase [Solirubrobacteraceae bacterium]|nr:SidA/IucD/PvdA family monooxygenase [Solirubrobacteraceae bacterium]